MFRILKFYHWKELSITTNELYYRALCEALQDADIAYRTKIENIAHSNRGRGLLGHIGESQNYSFLYQIYVRESDFTNSLYIKKRIRT